jgi:hypothetical protein
LGGVLRSNRTCRAVTLGEHLAGLGGSVADSVAPAGPVERDCFARDLLASERLGPKALRIVRHAGTDTAAVASDVRIREGYVRSLPTAIALVEQLTRNEGNGPSLKSAGAWPPATVVRDLIVNAAIHQDFSVAGVGPTVEVLMTALSSAVRVHH